MTIMDPPPIPPPPFYPRVRLPDIAPPRAAPRGPKDESLFHIASKLHEKKREIEADLLKGCDLPHHFREAPLFGRPPPVPKPPPSVPPKPQGTSLPPISGAKKNVPPSGASPPQAPPHDSPQRPDSWRKPWESPWPSPPQDSEDVPLAPPKPNSERQREDRPKVSLRGAHEAREQQRRERRQREEARCQREAENARQAEEEWEFDVRKRFQQDRDRAAQRERQNSETEAETRRAEVQARWAEAEARRAEAAAIEAKRKAERVRRRMEQAEFEKRTAPTAEQYDAEERKAEEQHARHRHHAKRQGNGEGLRTSPKAAAYMRRGDLDKSATLTGTRKVIAQKEEMLKLAEAAAMQQLNEVRELPSKKDRQKGFKELLRAWHPDKNPENLEVATAVFQRLQAERSRALGS